MRAREARRLATFGMMLLGVMPLITTLLACSGRGEAATLDGTATTRSRAGVVCAVGSHPHGTATPSLTAPFEDSKTDEAAFSGPNGYLCMLSWGGRQHVRPRRCAKDNASCTDPNTMSTTLVVMPEEGGPKVGELVQGHVSFPSGKSFIVAKFQNIGSSKDQWVGLAPGDSAFWLIEMGPENVAYSRFIHVSGTGPTWTKNVLRDRMTFDPCLHPQGNGEANADFGTCDDDHKGPDNLTSRRRTEDASRSRKSHRSPESSIRVTLQDPGTPSSWVSCTAGCCVANGGVPIEGMKARHLRPTSAARRKP